MTRGIVYISGPMTGKPDWNFPAFASAADFWRRRGWDVVSPAETDDGDTSKPRPYYMRKDIEALLHCTAIAMLPDWQESRGARLEHAIAKELDLEVYDAVTGERRASETVLEEAERIVNGPRRQSYGHPLTNHSRTAAAYAAYLGCHVTPRDVCNLNILQKISRDRHCPTRDNLVDIAGYVRNAEMCEEGA